ncbi:MAG: ABC transporter ATP-binding protein [Candidatus Cloacimonetes bacterium]|nr:ABC transporter ATP-binding protein [Candidatus Cloacimonadota bacterium]
MKYIVQLENVAKHYPAFSLKSINFNLAQGYLTGLVGPNGAGKTTLIKLLMSLLLPDSGEVCLFGKTYSNAEKQIKERIGFVYETPHFYDEFNLDTIAGIIAPFYSQWDKIIYKKLQQDFDLNPKAKFGKLSKGERTKFALNVALCHHAELLVLDEPTAGLDPVFRRELLEYFGGLISEGDTTILIATHITSDLDRTADYVTMISGGEIVLSSEKDRLLEDYKIIKGGVELEKYKNYFIGYRQNEFGIEALVNGASSIIEIGVDNDVVLEKPTLEDILFYTSSRKTGGKNE